MARASCINNPTECIVPDWPCVPYHNHPVMNGAPLRHQLTYLSLEQAPDGYDMFRNKADGCIKADTCADADAVAGRGRCGGEATGAA